MEEEKIQTHIPENQRVIDFLYRCMAETSKQYEKEAYRHAINEIYSYWSVIEPPNEWMPQNIGRSISRKIREFLKQNISHN